MRSQWILAALLCSAIVCGCGDSTPIRIGFLGGMSGRYSTLGEGGRDGLLLAIEDVNAAGGINGRKVELVIRNDAQEEAAARQGIDDLLSQGVVAIVGPMTSSMAVAALPRLAGTNVPLVSPTATSTALEGKDDALFRILSSDPEYAAQLAQYAFQTMKLRSVTVLMEGANSAYSESLGKAFSQAFALQGGKVAGSVLYSATEAGSADFIKALLKNAPDALFFIGNSVDTARMGQVARGLKPGIALLGDTMEERLLKLGGSALEGYAAYQVFDRADPSPAFRALSKRFEERYKQPLGYPAVTAFDAGNSIFTALRKRQTGEDLKKALIQYGPYAGIQGSIQFDAFGDSHRKAFVVRITDGKLHVIH
jgi:branched-chain amino acid transport system substrate-binding protein